MCSQTLQYDDRQVPVSQLVDQQLTVVSVTRHVHIEKTLVEVMLCGGLFDRCDVIRRRLAESLGGRRRRFTCQ
jgi:hypothetical protein